MVERHEVDVVLGLLRELHLVTPVEAEGIAELFAPGWPLADVLAAADSIHLHGRVDDVAALGRDLFARAGGSIENERDGYIKWNFPGSVNAIFSSIDIAEDDRLGAAHRAARPHLDHIGLDLRRESADRQRLFDSLPDRARTLGWRHASQGGEGRPVFCCHTSVARKHWVYPDKSAVFTRPVEIAYGTLEIHAGKMGCDLRPIDPAHPLAASAVCGASHGAHDVATGAADRPAPLPYAHPEQLARFGEVGSFASGAWKAFLAYYDAATQPDGALTRREKALIALAVAHARRCPYCIDSFTARCLDTGASPEAMHEAVHVSAALAAGIDLVHATQMQDALRKRGAID
jgi:alkylhydroperoxidase/carboxymuconolactone decarboxylase family protein